MTQYSSSQVKEALQFLFEKREMDNWAWHILREKFDLVDRVTCGACLNGDFDALHLACGTVGCRCAPPCEECGAHTFTGTHTCKKRSMIISDNVIDEIIDEIDVFALSIDEYEYGLPMSNESRVAMRNIIRNILTTLQPSTDISHTTG